MSRIPGKASYVSLPIDGKQFYRELRELGFAPEDAAEIASWIKIIFETQPAFLLRKEAATVKANLAFIGSKIFRPAQSLNMDRILSFSGVKSRCNSYSSYKKYVAILKEENPEILSQMEERPKQCRNPEIYRDRLTTIADILRAVGNGAKKTNIIQSARVPSGRLETYLEVLFELGFLDLNDRTYSLTEKGRGFLSACAAVSETNLRIQEAFTRLRLGPSREKPK